MELPYIFQHVHTQKVYPETKETSYNESGYSEDGVNTQEHLSRSSIKNFGEITHLVSAYAPEHTNDRRPWC